MTADKGRILLVEDDEDTRGLLAEMLESEGYTVVAAADGPTALGLALDYPFHLVLSDVRMPGMGGLEFVQRLRRQHGRMPVLLMSVFADWEMFGDAVQEGAVDLIRKPFRREELLRLVQQWVSGDAAGAECRAKPGAAQALRPAGDLPPPSAPASGERSS